MNSNTKHGYPVAGAAHEMHADHREHSGHNQHAGHSVAMFRDKFWLSLALALPVVFWSDDVQHWLGYHAPTVPGSQLIPPFLVPSSSCTAAAFLFRVHCESFPIASRA